MLFQKSSNQLYRLYDCMVDLLQKWLLRFIQSSKLPKCIWKIDISDKSNWLGPYNISLGSEARKTFNSLSSYDQSNVLKQVHAFYAKGTTKLVDYLPFDSKTLQSYKFLAPCNQTDSRYEQWVITAAESVPSVIKPEDQSSLEVEARLQQSSAEVVEEKGDLDVVDFWEKVAVTERFPTLVKLARAILIIPHGNADVERQFSMLTDIVTKKRSNLKPETIRAMVVAKSCLRAMNWNSSNLPITQELFEKCATAHANYAKRLKESELAAEKARQDQKEKDMLVAFQEAKKTDKRLVDLERSSIEKESKIKNLVEQKNKMLKIQEQALKNVLEAESEIETLEKEKTIVQEKAKIVTEKVFREVIKRKIKTSEGSSSYKIPKL